MIFKGFIIFNVIWFIFEIVVLGKIFFIIFLKSGIFLGRNFDKLVFFIVLIMIRVLFVLERLLLVLF